VQAGLSKHQARTNYASMQSEILRRMEDRAGALNPGERVFFDYALPDNLAFLTIAGLDWTRKHLQGACRYRYEHAFLLDMLDMTSDADLDPVRMETSEQRRWIHDLLAEIYRELGINIIRVPRGNVHERAKVLLQEALTDEA
jgi:predicted ATPase